MKLWKSPILYIGILLVIGVLAALIAPHVISWDSYRADIEDYGRKLTGRKVTIGGPIAVSLFPWPDIKLSGVRVANPEGAATPDFMQAESIEVSMTLAGLASGQFRVETINVVKPEFWVERMATAHGNWEFDPAIDLLGDEVGNHFRLDQIAISDATVHLIESWRGGAATFEKVNATIAGAEIRGPWRVRGSGDYLGRTLDISLNTGIWKAGDPFKFGLRLSPADGSGLDYVLDGANTGERFEGSLRIQPATAVDGKEDTEGNLRPLVFNSRITADFDTINLDKIEIAPRDSDGANLLAGSASIVLGKEIKLSSDLSATRFDLDEVAGAQLRTLVREGNSLEALQTLVDSLPESLEAAVRVKVVSLVAGGQPLENAYANLHAGSGTIRIDELSAELPGQAEGLFSGVFAATDKGPQLAGDLAFEAFNLRDFVTWLAAEKKDEIAKAWTGSRGLFKLEGRIDAAGDAVRLTNARFQVDDTLGSGSATIKAGQNSWAEFDLKAGTIDFDTFAPQGVRMFSQDGASSWQQIASLIAPVIPDSLTLKIAADKIRLNGTEANQVVLDTSSNASGISIDTLKISGLGDAAVDATGEIRFGSNGPAGKGKASIKAQDPRGLLRLAGLIPIDSDPDWAASLGASDVQLGVSFTPGEGGPATVASVSGKSGALTIEGQAQLKNTLDWHAGALDGSLAIESPSSKAIAELAGLSPVGEGEEPGKLDAKFSGSLQDNLQTDINVTVFGAEITQQGAVKLANGAWESSGRVAVNAERSAKFIGALGLVANADTLLAAESDYQFKDNVLALPAIKALWQNEAITGKATLSGGDSISGEFETSQADLPSGLGALFLPWDGQVPDPETSFSASLPFGLTGEIWVKPKKLRLFGSYVMTESQIGVVANADGKRIVVYGAAPTGGKVSIEVATRPKEQGFILDGKIEMPLDLSSLVTVEDGKPVASGIGNISAKFSGEGRSPAAALTALKGSGSYGIDHLKLERVDPAAFLSSVPGAKNAEDVRAAIGRLVAGGTLDLGAVDGPVTVVDGVAAFMPLKISSSSSDVELRPLLEVATGSVDIDIQLSLKASQALPVVNISYSGTPGALVRTVDSGALESQLGMQVLRSAMQELEAVQQEQKRILEEEARQAKIDAERLAAWEAHRKELQRRQSELKVFARAREEDERQYALWISDLGRQAKAEMAFRARQFRQQKQVRQQLEKVEKDSLATEPPLTDAPPTAVKPSPPSKPKAKPKAAQAPPEKPFVPLVLVPPAEPPTAPPPEQKPKGILDLIFRDNNKQ